MTVGEYAWCSFIAADRALVRCEQEHAAVCTALLRNLPEVTASNRTAAYAAIGLIGPRAKEFLMEIDLNPSGQIIQEALGCYEILLAAERGPELWEYLLDVRFADTTWRAWATTRSIASPRPTASISPDGGPRRGSGVIRLVLGRRRRHPDLDRHPVLRVPRDPISDDLLDLRLVVPVDPVEATPMAHRPPEPHLMPVHRQRVLDPALLLRGHGTSPRIHSTPGASHTSPPRGRTAPNHRLQSAAPPE